MSDETAVGSQAVPVDANESGGARTQLLSPGAMLRQAREASGLHIAALAVSMKVPVKKLEALEADRFDQLPDAVFVRALASAMCRALKVDAAPILDKLPQTQVPRLDTEQRAINTPFRTPSEVTRPMALPSFVRQPAVLAVLSLLLAALGVTFWPQGNDSTTVADVPAMQPAAALPSQPETIPSAVPMNAAPANAAVAAATTPVQDANGKAVGAPEIIAAPQAAAPAVASTSTAAPVAIAAPSVAAVPATAQAVSTVVAGKPAGAAPGAGVVVFRTKGASWISVTDAQGVLQLRKTLQAGESAEAGGALPLIVTVGKVDVTTVEVRGKPFNMSELAKDNVARFEVK